MMQGQRNIVAVAQLIMSELTPLVDAQHGAFFMLDEPNRTRADAQPDRELRVRRAQDARRSYKLKESLIGQCAFEKKRILLDATCPEDFIYISTGLGEAPPRNVVVLPVLFEGEVKAVIELASFKSFSAEPPDASSTSSWTPSASS